MATPITVSMWSAGCAVTAHSSRPISKRTSSRFAPLPRTKVSARRALEGGQVADGLGDFLDRLGPAGANPGHCHPLVSEAGRLMRPEGSVVGRAMERLHHSIAGSVGAESGPRAVIHAAAYRPMPHRLSRPRPSGTIDESDACESRCRTTDRRSPRAPSIKMRRMTATQTRCPPGTLENVVCIAYTRLTVLEEALIKA